MSYTLSDIAKMLDCGFRGDSKTEILGIREIQFADKDHLTFVGNSKYLKYLKTTKAAIVIIQKDVRTDYPNVIFSPDPQAAFARLIPLFYKDRGVLERSIHPSAAIDPSAKIGKNAFIAAHVAIGHDVVIGDNVSIHPNVTIYDHSHIGDNCIIHAGTVIGSDGFGFTFHNDHYEKIPQLGRVIIGNNVEFGANCAVDRSTIGDTEIGDGCKFDNHVQIAHNVKIGKHCVFAGQSGVAGSAVIDDYCVFGGQVAVNGHIHIGSGTQAAARSGITKDIIPGEIVGGYPAMPIKDYHKREVNIRSISKLTEKIKKLTQQK